MVPAPPPSWSTPPTPQTPPKAKAKYTYAVTDDRCAQPVHYWHCCNCLDYFPYRGGHKSKSVRTPTTATPRTTAVLTILKDTPTKTTPWI